MFQLMKTLNFIFDKALDSFQVLTEQFMHQGIYA